MKISMPECRIAVVFCGLLLAFDALGATLCEVGEVLLVFENHQGLLALVTIVLLFGLLTVFFALRSFGRNRTGFQYARNLIEASQDPLVTISAEGKITDVNIATVQVTGVDRNKLIGSDFTDYFTDQEKAREVYQQVFLQGFVTNYPLAIRHVSGKITDVLYNASVYRDDKGKVLGVFAAARDITELKKMESALRESEFRWKFAVEGSGDGLWDWDLSDNTVFYSKRWKEMLGYTEEEIGNGFEEWENHVHPDDRAATDAVVRAYLEGKSQIYINEHRLGCKDGRYKWILARGIVVKRDAEGKPLRMIGMHTDINQRKQIETELHRSNAELEQFAYAVSHDMRQPLRMVTSYLSLIEKALAGQLNEETQQFIDFAVNGAKRMDAMILSLLEYSRVGRKFEAKAPVSSKVYLEEALAFLNPELCACSGKLEVTGVWPELVASGDELTRLFQNLIGNALKYHEVNQAPQVHVNGSVSSGSFRVEVRDHGIGIDPGQIDRLFKVFSRLQARTRFEGNGVGLALCRKIVEHHGGSIGVESVGEGQGSVFWFELPLDENLASFPELKY